MGSYKRVPPQCQPQLYCRQGDIEKSRHRYHFLAANQQCELQGQAYS